MDKTICGHKSKMKKRIKNDYFIYILYPLSKVQSTVIKRSDGGLYHHRKNE